MDCRVELKPTLFARACTRQGERAYIYIAPNGVTLVIEGGGGARTVKLESARQLHSYLLPRVARKIEEAAEALAAPRWEQRCGPQLRVSAIARVEELRRLSSARYVPLSALEKALGRDALSRLEGGIPYVACHNGGVLVDLEALLSYARAARALAELAAPEVPSHLAQDMEVLERHGLVKRRGDIYLMPKSALALFPLSGELLSSVALVPDAVFRGVPRR